MKLTSLASFAIGVQTLRTNPLRTVLSTLGIIIGVAALVSILALGDGLEQFSRQQIAETTSVQTVAVQPRTIDVIDGVAIRRNDVRILTGAMAEDLTRSFEGRASAAIAMAGSLRVGAESDSARFATVVTALAPAPALPPGDSVLAGRWLEPGDLDRSVVVLGSRLVGEIGGDPAALVGRELALDGGTPFNPDQAGGTPDSDNGAASNATIIGIVDGPGAGGVNRAWVPLNDRSRPLLDDGGRRTPSMTITVGRIEDVPDVEQQTRDWLGGQFDDADSAFTVATSRNRVAQVQQAVLVFKLAMGAITGIAILVGGIGIMNVLLASVHERTREIGVRRAAGARRADIFLQFLAESVAVSGVGSLIGVVVGLGGAFGITAAIRRLTEAPVHAAFSWSTIVVAAAAAVLVGLAFGSYPAGHAARLSPMDAIRHE